MLPDQIQPDSVQRNLLKVTPSSFGAENLDSENQNGDDRISTHIQRSLSAGKCGAGRGNLKQRVRNMRLLNTQLVFSVLTVSLLAAPAFAGYVHRQPLDKQVTQSKDAPSNAVIVHGRVVGQDPDPRIRSEISRDEDSLHGE
jgi:hypothetical protein